ncbi:hypothetical protein EYZ11_007828 [Aspergillus tanneri]|uniref:Uncharacterized protein n=1 Tax=Aspergillus tanneri TaxID=1220188 RepID=A0A4S3JC01_9EURO|nr:hypothetical protein EYZ11_007828 [Aspergillus tanneri]
MIRGCIGTDYSDIDNIVLH